MFKRQKYVLAGILVGTGLLAAACGQGTGVIDDESPAFEEVHGDPLEAPTPGADSNTEYTSPHDKIDGYNSVVDAFIEQGAQVEELGQIEQPFFSVPGQIINVNGSEVQVYTFVDNAQAEEVFVTIDLTGSSIGTTMVSWVDTPHFYNANNVLAIYIGSSVETLTLIEAVLGSPIPVH